MTETGVVRGLREVIAVRELTITNLQQTVSDLQARLAEAVQPPEPPPLNENAPPTEAELKSLFKIVTSAAPQFLPEKSPWSPQHEYDTALRELFSEFKLAFAALQGGWLRRTPGRLDTKKAQHQWLSLCQEYNSTVRGIHSEIRFQAFCLAILGVSDTDYMDFAALKQHVCGFGLVLGEAAGSLPPGHEWRNLLRGGNVRAPMPMPEAVINILNTPPQHIMVGEAAEEPIGVGI